MSLLTASMKTRLGKIGLASILMCGVAMAQTEERQQNDWLLNAGSDKERFELLQRYLRGFDQPMWEVGERFRSIHDALSRNNYEFAAYHWEKIRVTIRNGYLKRPARQANADAIMLNSTWARVNEAFASKNAEQAWTGFTQAKAACMACHAAEAMPYVNNQALFDLAAPESMGR